jgi:hypothetical protein
MRGDDGEQRAAANQPTFAKVQISMWKPTSNTPSWGILKKSGARLAIRARNA